MKDSQYYPGLPKSWNGGVMSSSGGGGRREEGGRGGGGGGYPPWPPSHPLSHHHHLPPQHNLPRMLGGYYGGRGVPTAAHLGASTTWGRGAIKPPERWSPGVGSSASVAGGPVGGAQQAEGGMDLSSRPNGSQPNGVAKEPVSVIATNPLRTDKPMEPSDRSDDDDDDCMVIEEGEEAPRTGELPPHRPPQEEPSSGSSQEPYPRLPLPSGRLQTQGRPLHVPQDRHHLPDPSPRQQDPSIGLEAPSLEAPPAHHNPSLQGGSRQEASRSESSHHLPPSVRQETSQLLRSDKSLPPSRQDTSSPLHHLQKSSPSPSVSKPTIHLPTLPSSLPHQILQQKLMESAAVSQYILSQKSFQEASSQLIPVQQKLQESASVSHQLLMQQKELLLGMQESASLPQQLPFQPDQESASLSQQVASLLKVQEPSLHSQLPPEDLPSLPHQFPPHPKAESPSVSQQVPRDTPPPTRPQHHLPLQHETASVPPEIPQQQCYQEPASLPHHPSSSQQKYQHEFPHQIPFQQRHESASVPQLKLDEPAAGASQMMPLQQSAPLSKPAVPFLLHDSASVPHQAATQQKLPECASLPQQLPVQHSVRHESASLYQQHSKKDFTAGRNASSLSSESQEHISQQEPAVPPQTLAKPQDRVEVKKEELPLPESVDHVESLLENMFQQEDTPVHHPVIVSNNRLSPALTDDKVVEILQDREEEPVVVKTETPTIKTELESEVKPSLSIPQKNAFMQVESELEKMFAGIVEIPGDSDKPETPESSKSSKKSAKRKARRPRTKKSESDSSRKMRKSPPELKLKRRLGPREKITKEGSNDSSIISVYKSRGPFIRVSGGKEGPTLVTVVNSSAAGEEDRDRILDKSIKRKAPRIVEGRTKGPGLYSSTLSSRYNSNTIDTTWTCIFCNRRSHCEAGLGGEPAGDLFGPYLVHLKVDASGGAALSDVDVAKEQRKRGGGKQLSLRAGGKANHSFTPPPKKSRKSSLSEKMETEASGVVGGVGCVTAPGSGVVHGGAGSGTGLVNKEIWVHEGCAVWAPGVILVGPHLIGLDDAVSTSLQSKCAVCGESGACVSCIQHGCHLNSHYGCAKATQWSLDEDTFHAHCPHHKKPMTMSLALHQGPA